jgi:hypothetical protein
MIKNVRISKVKLVREIDKFENFRRYKEIKKIKSFLISKNSLKLGIKRRASIKKKINKAKILICFLSFLSQSKAL